MWRWGAVVLSLMIASAAVGQNIDMSTLPPRDAVQLTIYNGEDITLVRESRHVTVKKGLNSLQFSWANTLIDPTSVSLEFATREKELEIVDTRYPHDRPQVLYWNVKSQFDGDATVEISYFTSGISWVADYVGVTDASESSMHFDGFVQIANNSGEDYEDAQVRMVVGTINLVETIRELAERGLIPPPPPGDRQYRELSDKARAVLSVELTSGMRPGKRVAPPAPTMAALAPPEIVKEGLSEYFIFTVPGTETIKNGWSKRMRLFEGTQVPLKTVYRFRPSEYGNQLVRMFLVRNDEKSTLGSTPLPDGWVRLFRKQATGGLSVVAFVPTKYVPIGQEFEFNLGRDPQVILERVGKRNWRDDFWFVRNDPKKLYSPDKGDRVEPTDKVSGWIDHEDRVERIRNYRGESIDVEFRFGIDGDVSFKSALAPTLFDFHTPDFKSSVKAGETKELAFEIGRKQGTSAKQNAVTLEGK